MCSVGHRGGHHFARAQLPHGTLTCGNVELHDVLVADAIQVLDEGAQGIAVRGDQHLPFRQAQGQRRTGCAVTASRQEPAAWGSHSPACRSG